jgi:Tfp pilus assembly protein PilV
MRTTRRGFRDTNPKRKRGLSPTRCAGTPAPRKNRNFRGAKGDNRAGFSLLEVILALGTLAGAVVVLGEVNRLALRNATMARDLTRAQLLAESKMAEVVSGITAASPIDKSPFDADTDPTADDARWIYSIAIDTPNEDGLISVKVTVTKDLPEGQHPVDFSLVRWMPDPNAQQSSSGTSDSSGSNTNSSGGTSNGGS